MKGFDTIPKELDESARVDGRHGPNLLGRHPAAPCRLVVVALNSFVFTLNESRDRVYAAADKQALHPAVGLYGFISQNYASTGAARGRVTDGAPIVRALPLLQRYIVSGLTARLGQGMSLLESRVRMEPMSPTTTAPSWPRAAARSWRRGGPRLRAPCAPVSTESSAAGRARRRATRRRGRDDMR